MRKIDLHPTDEELIQVADGELSRRRAGQIQSHLAACWACRSRHAALEQTILDLTGAWREADDSGLPPGDGPHRRLRRKLAALDSSPMSWAGRIPLVPAALQTHLLAFSVATVLVAALFLAPRWMRWRADAGVIPDRLLTPGATRDITLSQACAVAHEQVLADVSPSLRQKVLAEYGIKSARPEDYEIDYLIAPGLGGTDSIRNLWPEPYKAAEWNAHVKDALEEHLHAMVCSHEIDLSTAQRAIASDWIAAYKHYFHTDRPLATPAGAESSRPAERRELAQFMFPSLEIR
jgi:hypothetical protein